MTKYVLHRHDSFAYPDKPPTWEVANTEEDFCVAIDLTEAEAHIFAWALNQVAENRRLTAYTIEQREIDDEGNLEPWVTVTYDGPTQGVAP